MKRVYLDNAATTRTEDEVLEAMMPFLKEEYGNASSIHSFGKTAKVMLEDTRDTTAEYIGASPKEIFFTGSGTESNNFAIKGIALKFLNSEKNHIITTAIEHSAVLDTMKYLQSKFNIDVTYLKTDDKGKISMEELSTAVRPETFLISIMHSNNEIGIINDLKSITETAAKNNVYVHTDSVQSIGKTEFNVKDLNINFATMSAHKIYGPKGISALYIKDKTPVEKFIHGGMQERDMRGGTENIAAVAGFRKAIELVKNKFEKDISHYLKLKNYLTGKLVGDFGDSILFNSGTENSLPNIVNISFDKNKLSFDEEMIFIQLDIAGIAVSGGSACTAGTHKPSYVLTALGRDKATALGSLRISFGRDNTEQDLDFFLDRLKKILRTG